MSSTIRILTIEEALEERLFTGESIVSMSERFDLTDPAVEVWHDTGYVGGKVRLWVNGGAEFIWCDGEWVSGEEYDYYDYDWKEDCEVT